MWMKSSFFHILLLCIVHYGLHFWTKVIKIITILPKETRKFMKLRDNHHIVVLTTPTSTGVSAFIMISLPWKRMKDGQICLYFGSCEITLKKDRRTLLRALCAWASSISASSRTIRWLSSPASWKNAMHRLWPASSIETAPADRWRASTMEQNTTCHVFQAMISTTFTNDRSPWIANSKSFSSNTLNESFSAGCS